MGKLGGSSIGEMLYRAGSGFLDNERAGGSRTMKEIGNFLLNPMRGLNRLTSGRSGRIYPNPADPYDRIPPNLSTFMKAGIRLIGDRSTSESFETDTTITTAFFEFDMNHGNVFKDTRRKPFDFFTFKYFDDIFFADVFVIFKRHATFLARLNFWYFVLKALQR